MGQEILYCAVCRTQLRGVDFERKTAVKSGMEAYCAGCLPEGVKPDATEPGIQTPRRGVGIPSRKLSVSSTKTAAVKGGESNPPTRRFVAPRKQSSSGLMIGGIVGAVVLFVIIVVAAGSSSKPKPRPTAPVPAPVPPPIAKKETPKPPSPPPAVVSNAALERQKAAIRSIQAADEFAEKNPDKREEIAEKYREAVRASRETEEYGRAQQKLDAALAALKEAGNSARAALEEKLKGPFAQQRFKEVLDLLREAERDRPDPAWAAEVEALRKKYRELFREAYTPLRKEAQAAVRAGNQARVDEIRKKVASFGLPGMPGELETALSKVKPEPRKDPAVAEYRKAWRKAMGLAGGRDYEGALATIEKASGALSDPKMKKESTLDVAVMKAGLALVEQGARSVSAWKKGKSVTFRYRNAQGALEEVEGKVEDVEAGRVLLLDGRAVEVGEISLASAVAAMEAPPEDALTSALACVAEGDVGGAKRVAGEAWEKVPEKYRTWKPQAPSAEEADARKLYYGALGKLSDPLRAAEGIQALRLLLEEQGETGFVRRNAAAIGHFSKQGREFLMAGARLKGGGSFALVKTEEVASAWVSRSDSAESDRPANYVELKFRALPREPYRLWVYAAGCCAEVMGFGVQGTDIKVGRSGPEAVPGSEHVAPVRIRYFGSRRTHDKHGGPKQPEKWYWNQVPLPEYETAGEKVVRIVTNQKGCGVGYAFLTALGTAPPKGAAIEKRLKERLRTAAGATRATSGLLMLYTFREGKGDVVKDVSGVEPAMDLKIEKPGAVEWLGTRGLKVKSSAKLGADSEKKLVSRCKKTNELTVEAWVVPASDDQKGPARIVTFSGDTSNRAFTMGQGDSKESVPRFAMRLHTSGAEKNGMPQLNSEDGTGSAVLTHLVFTRKEDGQERFYVNGLESKRGVRKGDFSPWTTSYQFVLANEKTGDRPWLGEFHLVAVYDRALDPQEVSQNFDAGPE